MEQKIGLSANVANKQVKAILLRTYVSLSTTSPSLKKSTLNLRWIL
jgi:hypothetical protein